MVGRKTNQVFLFKYDEWCRHPESDDSLLMLNSEESGVTLINEGNIIDIAAKTATVEFKRPLVVDLTDTMDLQSTYAGFDYLLYLSYSYQESDTANEITAVKGEIGENGRAPEF